MRIRYHHGKVDLSEAHAAELDDFLTPTWSTPGGWARGQGHQVSDHGRLPTDVVTASQAAPDGTY